MIALPKLKDRRRNVGGEIEQETDEKNQSMKK
jgi:hypothetical protein